MNQRETTEPSAVKELYITDNEEEYEKILNRVYSLARKENKMYLKKIEVWELKNQFQENKI